MRVLLSATRNDNYLPYWPDVAAAWRKLFPDCEPVLAYVDEAGTNIADLRVHGKVIHLRPAVGIPIASQACMARLFIAKLYEGDLCTVNDVDLLPLQAEYLDELMDSPEDTLLCVGREVYDGTPDEGKFPLAYFSGDGNIITDVVNPDRLDFELWIQDLVGIRVIDDKEDVISRYPHGHPKCFSDESLLRVKLNGSNVKQHHVPRGWSPYTERAICRSDGFRWDDAKLKAGHYVEAHLPHPYSDAHKPLMRHIGL